MQSLLYGWRYGLDFGGSDKVQVPYYSLIDLSLSVSLAAAVRHTADAGVQTIAQKFRTTGSQSVYDLRINNNAPEFRVRRSDSTLFTVTGASSLVAGKEYMLLGVFDGTTATLYVNGVASGTPQTVSGTLLTGSGDFFVGLNGAGGSGALGVIDEVQVWARPMTATEAAQHAIGALRDYQGLVGYWPFDEKTGSTAYDVSNKGSDGVITGAAYVAFDMFPGIERQFRMADLYTITLANGTAVRYTSADVDIAVGANVFSSMGPKLARARVRASRGLDVDNLEMEIFPATTDTIGGVPILTLAHNGGFDGASIILRRAFMYWWGNTSAGTIILFSGRVAEIELSRTRAALTVKSDLELSNVPLPRNLYQPTCLHTVYDAGCGLVKATWEVNGSVDSGSTISKILDAGLTQPNTYFSLGVIEFTSGVNNGVVRSIQRYTVGDVRLSVPLLQACSVGDTFKIRPGCNRLQNTCLVKFNNLAKFRGMPYIPVVETAI